MGQLQGLLAYTSVETTSSDDDAYYRRNGRLECTMRLQADAWKAKLSCGLSSQHARIGLTGVSLRCARNFLPRRQCDGAGAMKPPS
eukprot:1435760-Pyramimonas_sp.AAC.1